MPDAFILESCNANALRYVETLQDLWSGYGAIQRYALTGADYSHVIVKHIKPNAKAGHPRGWNTSLAHQRKLRSYQVERAWYERWSRECSSACRVPSCYGTLVQGDDIIIVMEDLDASGFSRRSTSPNRTQIKSCLKWLANFHASFLGEVDGCAESYHQCLNELWPQGNYWHLDTRTEEFEMISDPTVKAFAAQIDDRLKSAKYQTIIHGDAKIANFCLSDDGTSVAAVDFQYVGGGCGVVDVAYFLSSCLSSEECFEWAPELLNTYFRYLSDAVIKAGRGKVDIKALEVEWRALYCFAWADFYRFLQGWSPEHWKIHPYSKHAFDNAIDAL